ncbi:PilN domain-containing protein [Actinotalea ferrariae]|uniref:PilN domain-containing protein n=1 Tax=Actinotalea ferrariae TaxID=1386098 RepID=UPI001C8BB230|nr:PilN domain-containing protein [Actinotalea ferrariae]MBX9245862.1 PilN domain-containing protein [Actinotalea ferrariae]
MSPAKGAVLEAAPDGRVDVAGLGAFPMAQVNLLPPEVRSRRAVGRLKVRLVVALLVTLLVAALGFVYAAFTDKQATDDLAFAQSEVQRLQQEQAQYAEVPQVKSAITAVESARLLGTSTEVLWPAYVRAIQAVTPAGVTIQDLDTEMPSPIMGSAVTQGPLDEASVGAISFTGQALTLPDLSAWMDALERVPGFVDASYTTAELTSAEGVVYYTITTTVHVTQDAFADRHAPETSE